MKEIQTASYTTVPDKKDIKAQWWVKEIKDADVWVHMNGVVRSIVDAQSWRYVNNIRYARLYANLELLGFYGTMFSRVANMPITAARISFNVCKATVDTAASKIAKNRPRPLFLTNGGDWSQKNRAQKLTKYLTGAFEATDAYEEGQQSFTDSGVMGSGFCKIYKDKIGKKVVVERVLPDEIIVDDADGMYRKPRSLYQRRYVDRSVLIAQFPDKAGKIKEATGGVEGDNTSASSADLILVIEGWHLRSSEASKDGRHVITIENCTLFSEEYCKDYFPFAVLRWSPRTVGYFGAGIIEEVVGIQLEINKLLRNIQMAQHLACIPRTFIENGSQVNLAHITNEIGALIKYTGTAPIFTVAQGMAPEVYAHLENLFRKAFEIPGISIMSATSQKPQGLDSGVAIREYQDIETERFALAGQRYENFYMDIAKIMIDQTRDLDKELKEEDPKSKGVQVKVKGKKFMETIDWKDVDLDEDMYMMQVFPTSLLPTQPAGRLATVQELIQAGFIGKDEGMALLDFPDLEGFMSLQTAAIDDINMLIENMIEKGVYQNPEPFMNLTLAVKMTQSAYLRGKTEKVPEKNLELLRQFIDDCNTLINMALSAAQPQVPPAMPEMSGGAPIAVPEAPPTSELLPAMPQGA